MPNKPHQCEHVKINGLRCGSPALRGRRVCFYHFSSKVHHLGMVPILENGAAIQHGLLEIIHALLDERIDPKRARLVISALRIAALNLSRANGEPPANRVVVDMPPKLDYPFFLQPPEAQAECEPETMPYTVQEPLTA